MNDANRDDVENPPSSDSSEKTHCFLLHQEVTKSLIRSRNT